jgi:hypothetical protein
MSISNPDSEIIELCQIPILKLTKLSCCFTLYSHQQIYDYFFGQYEPLSFMLASILQIRREVSGTKGSLCQCMSYHYKLYLFIFQNITL